MTLNNRFVRSATWEGMCETDGRPTSKLASCYRELAAGGVGLIITGYASGRRSDEDCQEMSHDSHEKGERVLTNITIDDRKGMPNRIDAKVKSIERRIGKPLEK